LLGLSIALGIGLLVGAERERRKDTGPARSAAGIRTFSVTALLGAVSIILGDRLLLGVTSLIVGAGAMIAYQRTRDQDPGMTTEFALLLTCLLGGLAMRDAILAAGLGTLLALLLAARNRMHHFVRNVLTENELHDVILFMAAALIVLPLAPDRFMGPFGSVNPRSVTTLIVLVMAVSAAGHVAMRTLGTRYGLPLVGFASGFVSSTATIHSMGERARHQTAAVNGAAAGATFSSIATIIQMAIVIALVQPVLLSALALPLGMGGAAAGLYGLILFLRITTGEEKTPETGHAFDLKMAATFAILVSAVMILSAALNAWFGARGILLGAAVAGLADAHATAASAASLFAANKISLPDSVKPILLGLSTNTLMKAVVAIHSGGRTYAWRVVPGLVVMLASVWAGAWLSG
jgi:uncharacterized membrane protein (DUF4010 family)